MEADGRLAAPRGAGGRGQAVRTWRAQGLQLGVVKMFWN